MASAPHEATLIERADGSLLMLMHNQHPSGKVATTVSTDGGRRPHVDRVAYLQPGALRLPVLDDPARRNPRPTVGARDAGTVLHTHPARVPRGHQDLTIRLTLTRGRLPHSPHRRTAGGLAHRGRIYNAQGGHPPELTLRAYMSQTFTAPGFPSRHQPNAKPRHQLAPASPPQP